MPAIHAWPAAYASCKCGFQCCTGTKVTCVIVLFPVSTTSCATISPVLLMTRCEFESLGSRSILAIVLFFTSGRLYLPAPGAPAVPTKTSTVRSVPETLATSRDAREKLPTVTENNVPLATGKSAWSRNHGTPSTTLEAFKVWYRTASALVAPCGNLTVTDAGCPPETAYRLLLGGAADNELTKPLASTCSVNSLSRMPSMS